MRTKSSESAAKIISSLHFSTQQTYAVSQVVVNIGWGTTKLFLKLTAVLDLLLLYKKINK